MTNVKMLVEACVIRIVILFIKKCYTSMLLSRIIVHPSSSQSISKIRRPISHLPQLLVCIFFHGSILQTYPFRFVSFLVDPDV